MINFSIFKKEPYVIEIEKDVFEDSEEMIYEILKNTSFADNEFSTSFITANQNYDVYRVDSPEASYCIKYSLDPLDKLIKRDFDVLKSLPKDLSPSPFFYGSKILGDSIHYSITSFENAFNLKSLGIALIFENIKEFFIKYNSLQQANLQLRNYNEYLNDFLSSIKIENFPEESIEAMRSFSDFDLIKETIKEIEDEIFSLSDPKILRRNSFCHGRLKTSNILFDGSTFKFIDFSESYFGNVYLDISAFCIYSCLNRDQEKSFLDEFIKSNGKEPSEQDYFEYEVCAQISKRIIFLEILTEYFKEVYVFSSSRPMKILNLIDIFARYHNVFSEINCVKKHYEFIYKSILAPIYNFN